MPPQNANAPAAPVAAAAATPVACTKPLAASASRDSRCVGRGRCPFKLQQRRRRRHTEIAPGPAAGSPTGPPRAAAGRTQRDRERRRSAARGAAPAAQSPPSRACIAHRRRSSTEEEPSRGRRALEEQPARGGAFGAAWKTFARRTDDRAALHARPPLLPRCARGGSADSLGPLQQAAEQPWRPRARSP